MSSTDVIEANVAALRDSLNEFKAEVRAGFAHVRDEFKAMREMHDRSFERLSVKIDTTNTRIDATNHEVSQLSKIVIRNDSKLNALVWFWGSLGGVGGLITLITTLGKVFRWF